MILLSYNDIKVPLQLKVGLLPLYLLIPLTPFVSCDLPQTRIECKLPFTACAACKVFSLEKILVNAFVCAVVLLEDKRRLFGRAL